MNSRRLTVPPVVPPPTTFGVAPAFSQLCTVADDWSPKRCSWRTRDDAENELFRYTDGFHNTERVQKDLGRLSRDEYEARLAVAQIEPTTIPASPTRSR